MKKTIKRSGFTIVELVIVIAVIAVLAGVLIPTFGGIIERANYSNDTQLVATINKLLVVESIYTGSDPNDVVEIQKIIKENGASLKTKSEDNYLWYDITNNKVVLASLDLSQATPALVTPEERIEVSFNADLTAPEAFITGYLFVSEEADGDLAEAIYGLRNPESQQDLIDSLKLVSELENGSALYSHLSALMNRTAVMTEYGTFYVGEAKDESVVTRIIVSSAMSVVKETSVSGIKTRFPNVIVVDFHSGVKDIEANAVSIIDTPNAELYYVYISDEVYAIDHANGGNIEYLITKDERGQKINTVNIIYVDKTGKNIGTDSFSGPQFLKGKYTFEYNFPYLSDCETDGKYYAFNYYSLHKNDSTYKFAPDTKVTYTLTEDEKILVDGGENLVIYAVFEEDHKDFKIGNTIYSSRHMTYMLANDKVADNSVIEVIRKPETAVDKGPTLGNETYNKLTIRSTVTLLVPHNDTSYSRNNNTKEYWPTFDDSSSSSIQHSSIDRDEYTGERMLTIAEGTTLYNNGYITVDAVLHRYSSSQFSFVASDTGVLVVAGTVVNNSGSRFEAFGIVRDYVDENDNAIGSVTVENGGYVCETITVLDLHGGQTTLASIVNNKTPFNRFAIESIRLPMTINYGAIYTSYGVVDIEGEQNLELKLVSKDGTPDTTDFNTMCSNPMFKMGSSDACVIKSYNENSGSHIEIHGTVDDCAKAINVDIKTALRNFLSDKMGSWAQYLGDLLSVFIDFNGLSFTRIPAPFCDFDVTIADGAEVDLSHIMYKILPGSQWTIKEGGELTLNNKMVVYDFFELDGRGKNVVDARKYAGVFTSDSATLKVEGTLILESNSKFAGIIECSEGAKVNVKSGATIKNIEPITEAGNGKISVKGKWGWPPCEITGTYDEYDVKKADGTPFDWNAKMVGVKYNEGSADPTKVNSAITVGKQHIFQNGTWTVQDIPQAQ